MPLVLIIVLCLCGAFVCLLIGIAIGSAGSSTPSPSVYSRITDLEVKVSNLSHRDRCNSQEIDRVENEVTKLQMLAEKLGYEFVDERVYAWRKVDAKK